MVYIVWSGLFVQQFWVNVFFFYIYNRLEDGIQSLEKEANIDFCRSMNRIIFDQIIEQDPSTFAFVSVPEDNLKPVPTKGRPNGR